MFKEYKDLDDKFKKRIVSQGHGFVCLDGYEDQFYKIESYDKMDPFFMTLTSPEDHWIFISSTGGLTAGRKNSDNAIFPYYTDDKVSENHKNTGSKTIIRVKDEKPVIWEPFSDRYFGVYDIKRNLYKNRLGNILVFEEINFDLGLVFTNAWSSSPKYGIVKISNIANISNREISFSIIDGIRNTLPAGVTEQVQSQMSNLLNAYKRAELAPVKKCLLGIFSLTATLTDLAEPSESLKSTTWWHAGFEPDAVLLSSSQLDRFRKTGMVDTENDIKGSRGAFFVKKDYELPANTRADWIMAGEVNQTHTSICSLMKFLDNKNNNHYGEVMDDINLALKSLEKIIGVNDGLQMTGDMMTSVHHSANVLFNVMRGGYFNNGYMIQMEDLSSFIKEHSKETYRKFESFLTSFAGEVHFSDVVESADQSGDSDLSRLVREYLPVTFSRRHGDPSRPWNKFSINTRNEDGSARIDYQGNWRDIFQNWEALLFSNPRFAENIFCKFLNAVTADGYNPYRISRSGIDWEKPEPENPWANIGYWSDHQIIYLLKLLELEQKFNPDSLKNILNRPIFTHANVPYEIKKFEDVVNNPYDTIVFNEQKDDLIAERVLKFGSDGRLLFASEGELVHTSMVDKLLILLLAKMSNLVPDGGIWMTTQRPEWNDANNALVGKGVSVVTLSYLYRFVGFFSQIISNNDEDLYNINSESYNWYKSEDKVLNTYRTALEKGFDDKNRFAFMRESQKSADEYREILYKKGLTNSVISISRVELISFIENVNAYLKKSLENSIREDGLFHAYNTLEIRGESAVISRLYEMLEGQVAGISSGLLNAQQSDTIFNDLKKSSMYREDQHSYMLYPNRDLKGYLDKNRFDYEKISNTSLKEKLLSGKLKTIIEKDANTICHFNSSFRNVGDLNRAIENLNQFENDDVVNSNEKQILNQLFEEVFNHASFTGRSGTFYAYEGLGSIYWHMVSKLLLAAQETVFVATNNDLAKKLANRYFDIRNGIGFNKSPEVYGAFPVDPYSHTPWGAGAKQPGMTGQVKEEVLTRFAELGLRILEGEMVFDDTLVKEEEFLKNDSDFTYYNEKGQECCLKLSAGSYGFTFCQLPIVVHKKNDSHRSSIKLFMHDGTEKNIEGNRINKPLSASVFSKEAICERIEVIL
ncbi:MAG TPA: hypothetical protein P5123_10420 [Spirochaetota bacterium]|nr:hypothetical protein [Spirochaetota bacterium]